MDLSVPGDFAYIIETAKHEHVFVLHEDIGRVEYGAAMRFRP